MTAPYMPTKSKSVEWGTPSELAAELARTWGPFDLDVAASDELHVCPGYFTRETDGLLQPWRGVCYLNPPYGSKSIYAWLEKAVKEIQLGRAQRVVCLLPSRTDQPWWSEFIWTGHNSLHPWVRHLSFTGRLRYLGAKYSAPFGSAIVVLELVR